MATKVPTALHAEFTEYASLVRALRTTSTLNLTAHLLRHAENNNDTWTQWPLIDCPVPEWSLDDEIRHLAAALDPDPDLDVPADIVLHAGTLLVRILSLMADHRPSAPGSMQNRLWPMNWEDVIALVALCGVHPTVVARAEARLVRIYAARVRSPVYRTANRLDAAIVAKMRFSKLVRVHEDQLFAPPVLHPRARRKDKKARVRRRSKPPRVKTRDIVDSDTDVQA